MMPNSRCEKLNSATISDVVTIILGFFGILKFLLLGEATRVLQATAGIRTSFAQMLIENKRTIIVIMLIGVIGLLYKYISIENSNRKSQKDHQLEESNIISKSIWILIPVCMFLLFELWLDSGKNLETSSTYNEKIPNTSYNDTMLDGSNNDGTSCADLEYSQNDRAVKEKPQKLNIEERSNVPPITQEHDLVDYYVNKCVNEVLPISEWEALSDAELYYIRNGICAYSGRMYKSGYYDEYSWYEGSISPDDFDCSVLNAVQYENVKNIASIENQRKI